MNGLAHISRPDDGLRELALFAGAGGGILGGKLLGWTTVCAVEWEPYPASVLAQRQNDGLLPPFPIWDDVQTFDGRAWHGIVDVVSGGFPCQDISVAGKGAGITGERSGMWSHMARIVSEVRPRYVFVENSPALLTRGLGVVLGDLAALGYDCRWTLLGAADVGAPHQRDRFWLMAHAHGLRELQPQRGERDQRGWFSNGGQDVADSDQHPWDEWRESDASEGPGRRDVDRSAERAHEVAHPNCERQQEFHASTVADQARQHPGRIAQIGGKSWWRVEPDVGRVADGVAARVDRLKAIGNGQVPLCAATAWRMLTEAA